MAVFSLSLPLTYIKTERGKSNRALLHSKRYNMAVNLTKGNFEAT